jgi:hypothetical protein
MMKFGWNLCFSSLRRIGLSCSSRDLFDIVLWEASCFMVAPLFLQKPISSP